MGRQERAIRLQVLISEDLACIPLPAPVPPFGLSSVTFDRAEFDQIAWDRIPLTFDKHLHTTALQAVVRRTAIAAATLMPAVIVT